MPNLIALFFVLAVSWFFYRSGYYDKRRTKELKLHDSVKFIYGKHGQPIYKEACIIQTIGLIAGFSFSLQYLYIKLGIPIFIHVRYICAGSFLILGIAVFLDELLESIRRM
jgi:hypothetical protein